MTIDWGDAPAWVAIVLSFLFSLAAFIISLLGLKWQKNGALAAMRSANADERAKALAELALRLQLESAPRSQVEREQERHVLWELERRKDRFLLRNTGTAIATGVTVSGKGVEQVATQLPEDAAVRPGESVSFMMAGSLAHAVPDQIKVSWDGHPEPVMLPVPPR
ncbi:hypothetical protein [Nonomuraea guangzhouensis]|uniref:Uncharacterized protein n=1 Tax=Nonomuraea guangzhouensis TaxID=1291555 RepID=A0ABW4GW89_9ACTN|nr:hypothetical protein [Nonomuraea guangzhouensis]